jgi:hypothetical protein
MFVTPPEFVGVPKETLQTWLGQVQQAIQDLQSGAKVEVASYAQGDGSKAITYTRAQLPQLQARAQILARLVTGDRGYSRRPMRPLFL